MSSKCVLDQFTIIIEMLIGKFYEDFNDATLYMNEIF